MTDIVLPTPRVDKLLLMKLKQDAKVVSNINFILDKMDRDGHLHVLKNAIESVFRKEINFAVSELSKLQRKAKNFDMKSQLANNSFIFKENLKLIVEFLGEVISRAIMER